MSVRSGPRREIGGIVGGVTREMMQSELDAI